MKKRKISITPKGVGIYFQLENGVFVVRSNNEDDFFVSDYLKDTITNAFNFGVEIGIKRQQEIMRDTMGD